jgi:hypothetical protein
MPSLYVLLNWACRDVFDSIQKTSILGLHIKHLRVGKDLYTVIEQNPYTNSYWAKMARTGRRVAQVIDSSGKYVGVSVDGKFRFYGRSRTSTN